MKLQVTNKGPARTVDFLAVFAEGETKEFDRDEISHYQAMSGVPVFSSILADEDEFDVAVIVENDDEKEGDN